MTFDALEERCRQFIAVMHEGALAIDRQDAMAVEGLSRAAARLLAQIEQGWCLALSAADSPVGEAAWDRLRGLMQEALHQSERNQRRLAWWAAQTRTPSLWYATDVSTGPAFSATA